MTDKTLNLFRKPEIDRPSLVIGFDGWMDGGNVSTGTIDYLRIKLGALPFAAIEPNDFYILNIPGPIELTSLMRPQVRYEEGLIKQYDYPSNRFYAQPDHRLLLFSGKEPNLQWDRFSDLLWSLCRQFDVQRILFVGSVAGLAPHSREPRITCTLSLPESRKIVDKLGFQVSQYEGPGSFVTHLTRRAVEKNIEMIGMVAEIPAYLQGYNPKCIETMVRCVSSILGLHMACDELRALGEEYEKRVSELVNEQPELAQRVEQLEENYDAEVFNTELEDLKSWLHSRGIRVD